MASIIFDDMTDSELASYCRDDPSDEQAVSSLLRRSMPIIRSIAFNMRSDLVSADELISEGFVAFLFAVSHFDVRKNDSFFSFLSVCLKNRFVSVFRKEEKNRIIKENTDDDTDSDIRTADTPESIFMGKVFRDDVRSVLSEKEYEILAHFMNGLSYSDIAERLGISVKSVDNAMERSRRKLREYFRDN